MQETAVKEFIYDRAKNHFLGRFPEFLPIEQAYIHIGMYLGWMLENGLYSKLFEEDEYHQLLRFQQREMSCAVLSAIWDGDLSKEFFNTEGNLFTEYYYQSGLYHKDYKNTLAKNFDTIYEVKDSWENFDKLSKKMTARYKAWKKKKSKS